MPGTRVKIKWHGDKLKRQIAAEMDRRLNLVGEVVRGEIVRNISTPTRSQGQSKPGEFPHADTGKLRQSIFWDRTAPDTVIVGSALEYARHLEYGTSRMAARPFLRRSLNQSRRRIKRIMSKRMK